VQDSQLRIDFKVGEAPSGSETGKFRIWWWKGERTERDEGARTVEPREIELVNRRGQEQLRSRGKEEVR